MENVRQRLANEAAVAYPVLPNRHRGNSPAITISSSSSTPDRPEIPQPIPSKARRIVYSDDEDEDDVQATEGAVQPGRVDSEPASPITVSTDSSPEPVRHVPASPSTGSDTEEEDTEDYEDRPAPPFPVPEPAGPIAMPTAKPAPLPKEKNAVSNHRLEPFRPNNMQMPAPVHNVHAPAFVGKPVPVLPPAVRPAPWDQRAVSQAVGNASTSGPVWESFDMARDGNLYDPITSAADAEKAMRELVESTLAETTDDIDMSEAIVDGFREGVKLLPHQVKGKLWMRERETGKKTGGILADDMGLGKTIQALTRVVGGRPTKQDKADGWDTPTLVVCPTSLVGQWAAEIKKYCVGLRVIEHVGASRTSSASDLARAHVVITTYGLITSEHKAFEMASGKDVSTTSKSKSKKAADSSDDSDSDDDRFGKSIAGKRTARGKKAPDALFRVKWWRVVLDEAQNIKNRKAKASLGCFALQAKYRWVLTGTPLQNNVEELYSFFLFLQIRPLNDWQNFNENINKPVKSGRTVRAMKRLQLALKAIMLRRTKNTILDGKPLIQLPARIVDIIPCEFDDEEREFYTALENKTTEIFERMASRDEIGKNLTSVLVMLLRLRQACDHPGLIAKDYRKDADALESRPAEKNDADDLADLFTGLQVDKAAKCTICQTLLGQSDKGPNCSDCEQSIAAKARRRSAVHASSNLPPSSAKIRMILQLLESIDEKSDGQDKTIIFTQFTSMMDLLEPFLKHEGVKYVRYDGSMNAAQRSAAIEKIKESRSTRVILISFKAGGTGLNLTCCNNVILVDMWWNPALEDQAFDRAHRFGQTKDVNIYKLTVERTVEERILALQDAKRALAAAALSGDKFKNSKLGLDDLMVLFRSGRDEDEED